MSFSEDEGNLTPPTIGLPKDPYPASPLVPAALNPQEPSLKSKHQTSTTGSKPQQGSSGNAINTNATAGGNTNNNSSISPGMGERTSSRMMYSMHQRTHIVDAQKLQVELHQLDGRLDRLRKEIELRRTLPQTSEMNVTTAETPHSKQVVMGLQSRITAELCQLASENLCEELESKLQLNVSANGKDLNGLSPLHLAAKHGHTEAVEILLAFKASRNVQDNQGRRPLDLALQEGHRHLISLLSPPALASPAPAPDGEGASKNSPTASKNSSFGSGAGTSGALGKPGSGFVGAVLTGADADRTEQVASPPIGIRRNTSSGSSGGAAADSYDGFSIGNVYQDPMGTGVCATSGGAGDVDTPNSGNTNTRKQQMAQLVGYAEQRGNSPSTVSGGAFGASPGSAGGFPQAKGCDGNASFATTTGSQDGRDHGSGTSTKPTVDHLGLALVMMGLPARGKSFVSAKIRQYFTWSGIQCKIFSYRHYRKDRYRVNADTDRVPQSEEDDQICAGLCLDVNRWLKQTEGIAIIDGTFSTKKRRDTLVQWLKTETVCEASDIVFLELCVNNSSVIERHIQTAVRAIETENAKIAAGARRSSNNTLVDVKKFRKDYLELIKKHEDVYETLDVKSDTTTSFIKVVDGETFFLNEIEGAVITNVVYLLQNMHQHQNAIYLTCCGESEDEAQNRLGGNSKLTERGRCYAVALAEFMRSEVLGTGGHNISPAFSPMPQGTQILNLGGTSSISNMASSPSTNRMSQDELSASPNANHEGGSIETVSSTGGDAAAAREGSFGRAPVQTLFTVITSAQNRAIDTTAQIPNLCVPGPAYQVPIAEYPALDDLHYGDCEGQTRDEIKSQLPNTLATLLKDPYNNTWPNGESVRQLFQSRLEPLIHDIQSKDTPLLIVSHKPLIQGLLCFFSESEPKPELAPKLEIAKDSVIRVTYRGVEHVDLGPRVAELLAQGAQAGGARLSRGRSLQSSVSPSPSGAALDPSGGIRVHRSLSEKF